jgi:hypothetical protein
LNAEPGIREGKGSNLIIRSIFYEHTSGAYVLILGTKFFFKIVIYRRVIWRRISHFPKDEEGRKKL